MKQSEIFNNSEGNAWFRRNCCNKISDDFSQLKKEMVTPLLKFLKTKQSVLEIGCSSGENLRILASSIECIFSGIDPSSEAINYARSKSADFDFRVGTADSLPFENDSFDLVFFGFCLYLTDRKDLSKIVAEADRVLKNKGFLAIIDFLPDAPNKRNYSHFPGIFSYKMDYSSLFSVYPHFSSILRLPFSHAESAFTADPGERITLDVLFKDIDSGYQLNE